MVPYLKGSKLWPYVSGAVLNSTQTDVDKLANWETVDAQALSIILMIITPNVQSSLDCSSAKKAWYGPVTRYTQADPIAQNLA